MVGSLGRASDFSKSAKREKVLSEGTPVDGAFECHRCGRCVEEAEYFSGHKVLRWVCDEGHSSQIEVSF